MGESFPKNLFSTQPSSLNQKIINFIVIFIPEIPSRPAFHPFFKSLRFALNWLNPFYLLGFMLVKLCLLTLLPSLRE